MNKYKYVAYSRATNSLIKEINLPNMSEDMVSGLFGVSKPYGNYSVSGNMFDKVFGITGVPVDRLFNWFIEYQKKD